MAVSDEGPVRNVKPDNYYDVNDCFPFLFKRINVERSIHFNGYLPGFGRRRMINTAIKVRPLPLRIFLADDGSFLENALSDHNTRNYS